MADDLDIWRVAALLIKDHEGDYESAAFAAGLRAKELRAQQAFIGAAFFDKVEARIKELERVRYKPGQTEN